MRTSTIWLFSTLLLTQTSAVWSIGEKSLVLDGLSPEQSGLEIFREADRRESGYKDLSVDLEMTHRRGAEL